MRFSFKKTFGGGDAPAPKKATPKPRRTNPASARTKNEPHVVGCRCPKCPPRPAYLDDMPGMNYRPPTRQAKADSIELRRMVAEATLVLTNAREAYTKALKAFEDLGPLPDSIIGDLSPSIRKQLRVYATSKLEAPEVPWTVIKRVKSASRPGLFHEVREDKLHQLSCTCEGYKYNNRCWVLDDVREAREAANDEGDE